MDRKSAGKYFSKSRFDLWRDDHAAAQVHDVGKRKERNEQGRTRAKEGKETKKGGGNKERRRKGECWCAARGELSTLIKEETRSKVWTSLFFMASLSSFSFLVHFFPPVLLSFSFPFFSSFFIYFPFLKLLRGGPRRARQRQQQRRAEREQQQKQGRYT